MISNDGVVSLLEASFRKIEQDQMQDMPVLNASISVQAVGFREWNGRQLGVMVTPWMMSLFLLPSQGDDWSEIPLGEARHQVFPEKTYDFSINEFEGVGRCQTHALHSPMFKFDTHQEAVKEAERVLASIMEETDPEEADFEAERLRLFLEGDENALLEKPAETEPEMLQPVPINKAKALSRRDLLRGGA